MSYALCENGEKLGISEYSDMSIHVICYEAYVSILGLRVSFFTLLVELWSCSGTNSHES